MTDHQDEIGTLWKRVFYSQSFEGADKEVTPLLVLLYLSFEEVVCGSLLKSCGGSFLEGGIRAEHDAGAGCQGRADDRGWSNEPADPPPSCSEGFLGEG
jgi:hypothetical protein